MKRREFLRSAVGAAMAFSVRDLFRIEASPVVGTALHDVGEGGMLEVKLATTERRFALALDGLSRDMVREHDVQTARYLRAIEEEWR